MYILGTIWIVNCFGYMQPMVFSTHFNALFGGLSMQNFHMEHFKREGQIMGQMEHCYPQMLETMFIYGAPAWMQVPWRIVRPFMPKRFVSRLDFVNTKVNAREHKRLLKHIADDKLPNKHGGKNTLAPEFW